MLAATPPRRTSRSSARKDSDTLSSCSTTSESRKRPLKVMRWSVAMDPVMAICTSGNLPPEGGWHLGRSWHYAARARHPPGPRVAWGAEDQLNESPQAQELPALGLS